MMNEQPESSSTNADRTRLGRLELCGLVAAFFILCSPFIYLVRHGLVPELQEPAGSQFVGSSKCGTCHKIAYEKWRGSHHDLAMDVATVETVLGDFNTSYTDPYNGVTSRFFTSDNKYFVETEGPGGKPGTFEITHTFGVFPLQQYLVPFPGGRMQCLNIAWDVREGKWYRLPPYEVQGSDDWLHWTRGGQTWNGMCAECHSTRLQKGFDVDSGNYETSWVEIDVGCEACHGPGSKHVDWADLPALARPQIDNFQLPVKTGNLQNTSQVAICAPCHSRRFQLGDNTHDQGELLDKMVPSLLTEGLYYADGQILDEVYVYGSFSQSKMYQHGVKCSDCHDMHSLAIHKPKNELCTDCHRAEVYDSEAHHFHKKEYKGKESEGYLCVKCHMPGKVYMGADYRPDHSLRIPRPDLSMSIGTPNSCSAAGCHDDKPVEWSNDHYTKWYGESKKPHYGELLTAGRAGKPGSEADLINLAEDALIPPIVRATALSLLQNYPVEVSLDTMKKSLDNENALLRYTAIRSLDNLDEESVLQLIAPKLYDKVKAVRIEAGQRMASIPEEKIRPEDREVLRATIEEYRQAMLYNADFAAQRYNLGNLAKDVGEPEKAVEYFRQAIAIDDQFYPAKVNLAMAYNSSGENEKAEKLLREVVSDQPELYQVAYSLGLLLGEMDKYGEAAEFFAKAADGMPGYSRPRYNEGLAYLKLQKWSEGERAILQAIDQDPGNLEYFRTLVSLYVNFRDIKKAKKIAQETLEKYPEHPEAKKLLRLLREGAKPGQ